MEMTQTALPDVKLIKPKLWGDQRGFFQESYNQRTFSTQLGILYDFVQDNHSRSTKNVLRGLHYQIEQPQGKIVRVTKGEIFDVAVDLRKSSPFFGKWVGMHLSESNHLMAWIPPGFAHGFLALSDEVDVLYKTTTFYHAASDQSLLWNDPSLGIQWPLIELPFLSQKDAIGKLLKDAECFP
jgi:dTDP-4-dehydrorhamnose 3,5-epimerase